ncbi:hypothetical protein GWN15_15615 [candidate division KSB1 bacterium]|nr:hypothetical protein [candidate division KSB1 bacterium]
MAVVGKPVFEAIRSGEFSPEHLHQFENYTVEQIGFETLRVLNSLTAFDNIHFQYQSGFISDEAWQAFRHRLRTIFESPIARQIFESDLNWYRASYRELCEQLISEVESEDQ